MRILFEMLTSEPHRMSEETGSDTTANTADGDHTPVNMVKTGMAKMSNTTKKALSSTPITRAAKDEPYSKVRTLPRSFIGNVCCDRFGLKELLSP